MKKYLNTLDLVHNKLRNFKVLPVVFPLKIIISLKFRLTIWRRGSFFVEKVCQRLIRFLVQRAREYFHALYIF